VRCPVIPRTFHFENEFVVRNLLQGSRCERRPCDVARPSPKRKLPEITRSFRT
jgi:hypothetical protein